MVTSDLGTAAATAEVLTLRAVRGMVHCVVREGVDMVGQLVMLMPNVVLPKQGTVGTKQTPGCYVLAG